MIVSDEIIEAAARTIDPAAFDLSATLYDPFGHEEPEMRLGRQSAARATATHLLSAVAPLIAQQALLDAANAWADVARAHGTPAELFLTVLSADVASSGGL